MTGTSQRIETAVFRTCTSWIRKNTKSQRTGTKLDPEYLRCQARNCEALAYTFAGIKRDELMKRAAMFNRLAEKAEKHETQASRCEYPEMGNEVR